MWVQLLDTTYTGGTGMDIYVTGGTMNGTNLDLNRNDGQTVTIDLSSLASDNNTYVTGGTVSGTNLTLNLNDGSTVTIDVSTLAGNDTYVTGGTTSADTGGTTNIDLDLGLNDGSNVNIDLSQAFTFMNAAAVKKTVGGITTGDLAFASGKTLHEIIQMIFYPAIAPTISYSSAGLTKSFSSLVEIGYTANLTLTGSFTRGQSVVSGQTTHFHLEPSLDLISCYYFLQEL